MEQKTRIDHIGYGVRVRCGGAINRSGFTGLASRGFPARCAIGCVRLWESSFHGLIISTLTDKSRKKNSGENPLFLDIDL